MSRLRPRKRVVSSLMIAPRCLVIGHRGASATAPENTRAAIMAARHAGADMVELDVQQTADGRVVVFHDARLTRTTNGRGLLRRLPYARLVRLDVGAWFAPRFRGERLLTLGEALAAAGRMEVNVELKRTSLRRRLVRAAVAAARRARAGRRVLWSSFDAGFFRYLPAGAARALICAGRPDASLARAARLRCRAWHPREDLVTLARIARAHALGLRVHAWTVDRPARARQLRRWGVDGLFTNDPACLRRTLGSWRRGRQARISR